MQQRKRIKQTSSLSDRLSIESDRLRQAASEAGKAEDREALLQRALQYESALNVEGWLRSELQPPK